MNASLLRRSIAGNLPIDPTAVPTLTMSQISHRVTGLRLLYSSSKKQPSWENPEKSIGDFCCKLGRSKCWHAQGPARELFVRLADEIKTYLDRNCEPPSRELHWSLYMIGWSEFTARPVLMFICEDSNSRKSARRTIKDSGILLRYPGVDTADCSHPPDFGQLVQLASRRNMDDLEDLTRAGSWSMDTEDSYFPTLGHLSMVHRNLPEMGSSGYLAANTAASTYPSDSGQLAQQPGNDEHTDGLAINPANSEISIFYRPTDSILGSHVFVNDSGAVNLPPRKATAGVIVKLGDKICFLTAAHGLASQRPPSDLFSPFEYDIDGESDSNGEEFLQTIRQGSRSPLSKHSDWGLVERARSKSRSRSKSRTRHDFDLFAPDNAHERPLELGTLMASSAEGSHPGLDYALIKIEDSHASMLRFNNGIYHLKLDPTRVSKSRPKDTNIVAITGSSGYLSGRLLGTPSFSRAPDQEAQIPSQELWTVKFDGKIEEGDCGTCVFDAQTGDLYGHVVAGNPDSGYAYIVPAYQVRYDLLKRFGEGLQLYKPTIHVPYGQVSTPPDRWLVKANRTQSKRSPWVSSHTISNDQYNPLPSETHQTLTPDPLKRRSRNASHGAALVRKGREYFTPGRIFVVRWSEPIQDLRTKASSSSEDISVINGQPMISYWRRMVVIKTSQAENSSTCVGMFTYGGQGLAKPGLDIDKHALVFDERLEVPWTRPDEPSLKGPPLAVSMESPFEKFDPMHRINFGVTYTVQHNMKIRDVGHIAESSMKDFETYVAEALKVN